jgi:hypothetical protein
MMQWTLGAAHNKSDWDAHKTYRVRIEAERPFGAIEPFEYVISVDDLDGSPAAPPGNLHAVAAELHEMPKVTKDIERNHPKRQSRARLRGSERASNCW